MGDTGAMIHIQSLIDDAIWFETIRGIRWPHGVQYPSCDSPEITQQGHDDTQPERQRFLCKMMQRGGEVVIRPLATLQQVTIKSLMAATIAPGTRVYTVID
jgi:hypothetical protein